MCERGQREGLRGHLERRKSGQMETVREEWMKGQVRPRVHWPIRGWVSARGGGERERERGLEGHGRSKRMDAPVFWKKRHSLLDFLRVGRAKPLRRGKGGESTRKGEHGPR